MKTSSLLIVAAAAATFAACAPASQSVKARRDLADVRVDVNQQDIPKDQKAAPQVAEPKVDVPKLNWITQDGGQRQFDFNPRLDILFVVDNSDSMIEEQEKLSRNMNLFAQSIRQNRMIDYHIGVISVWDDSDTVAAKSKYKNGELRRVRTAQGRELEQRFITRALRDDALLASTLKIGTLSIAQGGPENEQIFSPLLASFERIGHADTNENFFRDDAQLVVVIVTDSDEYKQDMSPEKAAEELIKFKGGRADMVTVYGVLTRADDPDEVKDWSLRTVPKYHPECFDAVQKVIPAKKKGGKATTKTEYKRNGVCKKPFGPEKLEQFIRAANPEKSFEQVQKELILSLNQKDYGKDLSKIGGDIAVHALEKNIILDQRPRCDAKTGACYLKVFYNDQMIPENRETGWSYNAETNSIHLSGKTVYKYSETARFKVMMVPIEYTRAAEAPSAEAQPVAAPAQ